MLNDSKFTEFIDFVFERNTIWEARQKGLPAPWTSDPILRDYHFCNVFRELDKTSAYLYEMLDPYDTGNYDWLLVTNIALFRAIGTIAFSKAIGGFQHAWTPKLWIEATKNYQEPIFTRAYNVHGTIRLPEHKGQAMLAILEGKVKHVWDNSNHIVAIARDTNKLAETFKAIFKLPGYGNSGFMAYEIVTDMRHTGLLKNATDKDLWANPGPGSRLGLNYLYDRDPRYNLRADLAIGELQELLSLLPRIGKRQMELRNIEDCCCEFSKYVAIKSGKTRGQRRYPPTNSERRKTMSPEISAFDTLVKELGLASTDKQVKPRQKTESHLPRKTYYFQGKELTISQIAKKIGVKHGDLYHQVVTKGKSLEAGIEWLRQRDTEAVNHA